MSSFKRLISLAFLTAGLLIYSGCSSTSNTLRYNDKSSAAEKDTASVRYAAQLNPVQTDTVSGWRSSDTLDLSEDTTDTDDLPENESNVDVSEVMKRFESTDNSSELNADKGTLREKMLMEIIKYLNTPYKYGGTTKRGMDCSAFTQKVYRNALSVDLYRTAREQYKEGEKIHSIDDLRFGDLVFFNTRRRVRPGHVGIYIGDHLFAHSSSKYGVTVSTLDHNYYSRRFMGGRRIEEIPNPNSVSDRIGN